MRSIGNKYEDLSEKFLSENGYLILERNFYSLFGEIDIICEKKDYIIFVEVKYRSKSNFGLPREFVSKSKQNKIKKTSLVYISKHNIQDKSFRYDVIEILQNKITHLENAFY